MEGTTEWEVDFITAWISGQRHQFWSEQRGSRFSARPAICPFDPWPLLSAYWSILEQDTEPQIALNAVPSVCECMCGWLLLLIGRQQWSVTLVCKGLNADLWGKSTLTREALYKHILFTIVTVLVFVRATLQTPGVVLCAYIKANPTAASCCLYSRSADQWIVPPLFVIFNINTPFTVSL